MKLFALTLTKTSEPSVRKLHAAVEDAVRSVYKQHVAVRLHQDQTSFFVQAEGIFPLFQLDRRTDALYSKVAEVLAEWIVQEEEGRLIRTMIVRDFDYKREEDIVSIMGYCRPAPFPEEGEEAFEPALEQSVSRRKQMIAQAISAFLQEYTDLNVQGFLQFRLQDYMNELREAVEYAIDEFLMDQQYQEFISLLKYFVYIQEAKIPTAHLIHKGGNEFVLLNDRMELIDTSQTDATFTVEMIEKDINFEDVIVSTLISVSPRQICIHTRDPEVQVIKTITQIFENRVQLCEYCRLCHNLDRSAVSDYNKG
ncbi:putative sporulation protein YtxC [Paenibacillus sp. OAS669]|uniref:putative sporulation protein YtxC n=1 Tax=Paenibacillus sp. OAS669 TaxID=2663821 RepID=UPI00178A66EF|nr:putative sporulation protein YtxC [Paenibacillus sp. OAS669]MBE1441525.1 putative sporulation protein YtxC [Paenibacillus sp. OAS669]